MMKMMMVFHWKIHHHVGGFFTSVHKGPKNEKLVAYFELCPNLVKMRENMHVLNRPEKNISTMGH